MTFTCPKIPNICEKLLNVGGDWMDPTCDVFSTWHCPERDHLWCLFCSSSLLGDAVTGVWGPSVSEGSQLTRSRPPPVPRSRPCSRYQPQFLNLSIPPTSTVALCLPLHCPSAFATIIIPIFCICMLILKSVFTELCCDRAGNHLKNRRCQCQFTGWWPRRGRTKRRRRWRRRKRKRRVFIEYYSTWQKYNCARSNLRNIMWVFHLTSV